MTGKSKFLLSAIVAISSIFSFSFLPTASTFAAGSTNYAFTSTDENCDTSFLGLVPWSCRVNIGDEESLKSGIWKIAANVATDITIIAAYLVLGFVIYGGYLYMFSGGDTGKVASGRKTLTNAFIGLAIVMTAYVILTAIRFALIGASSSLINECDIKEETQYQLDCNNWSTWNPTDMVTSAIQWAIGIAGLISVIFIVYGGISYATSSGDPSKTEKAKKTITYALIGLAIVALAEIITAFVSTTIKNANNQAYQITNQTIISKEVHDQKIV